MPEQYIKTSSYGDKFHYKDPAKTIRHREDGPAVEWAHGDKVWYVNGVRHRLDSPAIEYADGVKSWYVDGIFIFDVDTKGNILYRIK